MKDYNNNDEPNTTYYLALQKQGLLLQRDYNSRHASSDDNTTGDVTPLEPQFRSLLLVEPASSISFRNSAAPCELFKYDPNSKDNCLELDYEGGSLNPFTKPNPETGIKRIGPFHPVSRCNVEVDKRFLPNVLKGLVESFRLNSFHVTYETNPTICARCYVGLAKLEFVVLVWLSRNDKNKVLIEIDRVSGESSLFHSYYSKLILQCIMDATTPGHVCPSTSPEAHRLDPIARWTSEGQCDATNSFLNFARQQTHDFKDLANDPTHSALEIVEALLTEERFDSIEIALDTLFQLTDACTSGIDTTRVVSDVILTGRTKANNRDWMYVREKVLYLAATGCYGNSSPYKKEDLTRHAFTALAVIAQAVNHGGAADLNSLVSCTSAMLSPYTSIVDKLLENVRNADSAPNEAYLSTHILAVMCWHKVPDIRSKIQSALDVIHRAHRIGAIQHAALEQASGRLLLAMNA